MKDNTIKSSKSKMSTRDMVLIGMFAALMAVFAPIAIPSPGGVPMTLQIFVVPLMGVILGWKRAVISIIVYLLIGAAGAPVFSNFRGGFSVLAGMTGGYLFAYPLLAGLAGVPVKRFSPSINFILSVILALIGLAAVEIIGGLRWAHLSGEKTFGMIMAYSFIAFIPKDTILTILAVIVGRQIRKPLIRAGYLD